MTNEETEELRAFLREYVSTFEELETLSFFARAPAQAWNAEEVAAALKLPRDTVDSALSGLAGRLLASDTGTPPGPRWRYGPSPHLEPLVQRAIRAYEEQRLVILQIMSANALERVRSAAARHLAAAFRLERNKK